MKLLRNSMDTPLEKKVAEYCTEHALFLPGTAVLVALSGGGDSVGLLHILMQLRKTFGITLEAAHLNHSLRGTESDEDERFCRELCEQWKIPLTVKRLALGEIAGKNDSIETTAREERRSFLKLTMKERGLTVVATGHTLGDQAETILQRIFRGTGPTGLQGMTPSSASTVRPLLCATRTDIRTYLARNRVRFREDSTNEDTRFFRNRIRHELIPLLRESFSPAITELLSRMAELSRIQESFVEGQAREAFERCCIHADSHKILLDNRVFMGYHKVLRQRMVRHCLETLEGVGRDTDMDEVERVLRLVEGAHGVCDIASGIRCEVDNNVAAFVMPVVRYDPIPLNLKGDTVIPLDGGIITAGNSTGGAEVDGRNSVLVTPGVTSRYGILTVGLTRRGERMNPHGKQKPVKIRELLSVVSLPVIIRDTVPVIRAGGVAVWIPGIRSSELLRLSNKRYDEQSGGKHGSLILTFRNGLEWHPPK